jgi:hypothetical protein
LESTHTGQRNLVVMTVHVLRGPNTGYHELREDKVFTDYEQLLFSRVISLAEKAGKHVDLMVVPSPRPIEAIVQAAAQLVSAEIVVGSSAVMGVRQQALRFGEAWEQLPHKPRHQVQLRVFDAEGVEHTFSLGAHPPTLAKEDIGLIHQIWMEVKDELRNADLRHRDIVTLAVRRLRRDLDAKERAEILKEAQAIAELDRPGD